MRDFRGITIDTSPILGRPRLIVGKYIFIDNFSFIHVFYKDTPIDIPILRYNPITAKIIPAQYVLENMLSKYDVAVRLCQTLIPSGKETYVSNKC